MARENVIRAGIASILILLNAVAAFRLWARPETSREPGWGPLERAITASGQQVTSRSGRPAVVITVDDWQSARGDVERAFATVRESEAVLMLIVPPGLPVPAPLKVGAVSAQVVHTPLGAGPETFGLNSAWNHFYVYDGGGRRLKKATMSNGGLVAALHTILGGVPPFQYQLETEVGRLGPSGLTDAFAFSGSPPSGRGQVALFVSWANQECPVTQSIIALQRAADGRSDLAFSIVVPASWTNGEIEAFRSAFHLTVPVRSAAPSLDKVWSELRAVHGKNEAGQFLIDSRAAAIRSIVAGIPAIQQVLGDFAK